MTVFGYFANVANCCDPLIATSSPITPSFCSADAMFKVDLTAFLPAPIRLLYISVSFVSAVAWTSYAAIAFLMPATSGTAIAVAIAPDFMNLPPNDEKRDPNAFDASSPDFVPADTDSPDSTFVMDPVIPFALGIICTYAFPNSVAMLITLIVYFCPCAVEICPVRVSLWLALVVVHYQCVRVRFGAFCAFPAVFRIRP